LVEIIGGEKPKPTISMTLLNFIDYWEKTDFNSKRSQRPCRQSFTVCNLERSYFILVSEGVCSAGDIDIAITNGPRLRWAIFGPYLNMQLANQHGFKAAMHHLGEPMSEWWADMHPYTLSEEKLRC
jgi:3-hydroxyacyl-CoA dehydrogenase